MGAMDGRRAIVTGAASGIGRATAHLLAREGARVLVVDLDGDGAEAVAHEIRAKGREAIAVRADVTRDADCRAAVDQAVEAFGGLDTLVNCAGVIRRANAVDLAEADWDLVMAVNVKSVYLMAHHAVPVMAGSAMAESASAATDDRGRRASDGQRRGGAIVNIGSGWGLKGGPDAVAYCASKGAVVNMTRAMAIDHGPQGIRVNCVCPGDTDTPMLRAEARQLGADEAAFLAESAERPLARLGTPDDVAQAILYLVSDASSWVTGTTLVVDGGGIA